MDIVLHNDEFVNVNEAQHDCKNPLMDLTRSDAPQDLIMIVIFVLVW